MKNEKIKCPTSSHTTAAHALQLRVARGIAGSTLATAVALFTGLCYKLQEKAKKARQRAMNEGSNDAPDGIKIPPLPEPQLEAQVLF